MDGWTDGVCLLPAGACRSYCASQHNGSHRLHRCRVGLGMAVAPLPRRGIFLFFFGVLRHCVLDTVLGFGSVEMGWRQERTMACDVRNLLGTKVSYYSLVVADVLPLGNGPFGFWLYAEVF